MLTLDEIRKELGEYTKDSDEVIEFAISRGVERIAINHFGRLPYMNDLREYCGYNSTRCIESGECVVGDDLTTYGHELISCDDEELRERCKKIDIKKTISNIISSFPDAIVYSVRNCKIDEMIIFHDKFIYSNGVFYTDENKLPKEISDCIVEKEYKPQIRWVLRNSRGNIQTKYMEVSQIGDISENYNDDFLPVNEKINSLLYSDESCIIILHGKAGTGKSSYIRHLIANNKDVNFYWLDSSMFSYIDSSEFIEFIATCKNSVFVLEDSEILLRSRDVGDNIAMQSLLNISDGILGDSLKLKFICTFNTELSNVDKAILRKGRLKIKYEFKDLKKEKVSKLFKKIGISDENAKSMPLCDVYNFMNDNGYNDNRNKIGF